MESLLEALGFSTYYEEHKGNLTLAGHMADAGVSSSPNSASMHLDKAMVQWLQGDTTHALASLDKADSFCQDADTILSIHAYRVMVTSYQYLRFPRWSKCTTLSFNENGIPGCEAYAIRNCGINTEPERRTRAP